MASRGWEQWTEADIQARTRRISEANKSQRPRRPTETGQGATNGQGAGSLDAEPGKSLHGHPDAIKEVNKSVTSDKKCHKYRAEPCIVTADLTLFTKHEIEQAEAITTHPLKGTGSLKLRANYCDIFGVWFGSLKEGRRYIDLRRLEQAGQIQDLECQQVYPVHLKGVHICDYRADFSYTDREHVVEDVKGMKTPVYRLKKKLVEALYGIIITET